MRAQLFALLFLVPCATALAAANPAQIIFPDNQRKSPLFGEQAQLERPYIAPGQLFAVQLPQNWETHTFAKKPDLVEVRTSKGSGSATLQIRRSDVAEGARPKQLMLRALEQRLSKLPHFEETGRRELTVNGLRATAITGTFWFQGNAEYPRALEDVFLVVGRDAFELHFECFAPAFEELSDPLATIYRSFVARPQASGPQAPAPAHEVDDLENPIDDIPF